MTFQRLFLFHCFFLCATAAIIQIQIVHRHGARDHLTKHAFDPAKESFILGLFPGGIVQLANLGAFINSEYIAEKSPSRIQGASDEKRFQSDTLARSSNSFRTLVSSRVFLNELYGLDGDGDRVPTVVYDALPNDWRIRGYALCPKLAEKLEDFVNSDEYRSKNDNKEGTSLTNAEFLQRIGSTLPDTGVEEDDDKSLKHVFNIYDRFLIIENDGYNAPNHQNEADKLQSDDFKRLKDLADWYESSKFDFSTHRLAVAGGLMSDIVSEMHRVLGEEPAEDTRPTKRIIEYSAHYPTLLTLLATLRGDSGQTRRYPADKIPGFGAALIFELHKEGDNIFVRLKWYQGDGEWRDNETGNIEPSNIAVGRAPCEGEDKCSWNDFTGLLTKLTSEDDPSAKKLFCGECESDVESCLALRVSKGDICSTKGRVLSGLAGWVVGIIFGVALGLVCKNIRMRRKSREMNDDGTMDDSGGIFR